MIAFSEQCNRRELFINHLCFITVIDLTHKCTKVYVQNLGAILPSLHMYVHNIPAA